MSFRARIGLSRRTLLKVLDRRVDELHGDELEAALLKALDDLANEPTLDAVGLGAFSSALLPSLPKALCTHLDHDIRALVDRHVGDPTIR